MNLAVGQSHFILGDTAANLDHLRFLLAEADRLQADALVLPELASSGYMFTSLLEALPASEEIPSGPASRLLTEWSRAAGGRLVVCGICERAGERLYNSAAVFASGQHLVTYRKLHLFNTEKNVFSPGTQPPPVFTFNNVRYGLMICFDWFFPEVTRRLALEGAQVILHPANLVLPYCQAAMITRSIENRVYSATANRSGTERGVTFSGMSQATAPRGELLFRAGGDFRGVLCAEIDSTRADDKRVTPLNDLFADRRPEFYTPLCEKKP
jgi:predicted amidohydrolase